MSVIKDIEVNVYLLIIYRCLFKEIGNIFLF